MENVKTLIEFFKSRNVMDIQKEIEVKTLPYPVKVKAVSLSRYQELQARFASKDPARFQKELLLEGLVEPNMRSAELIESLGVSTPEEAVNICFLPGEFQEIVNNVITVSGFDLTIEDKIKQAKN